MPACFPAANAHQSESLLLLRSQPKEAHQRKGAFPTTIVWDFLRLHAWNKVQIVEETLNKKYSDHELRTRDT